MNPIVPPLKAGDRGDGVANLQDALLLLLERAVIPASEDERRSLTALLQRERQPAPARRAMGMLPGRKAPQPVYGDGTTRAVTLFQQKHQLPSIGQVDERTAAALNAASIPPIK
jgi:peptidoglycan hydrolase-like protein with peptidoglycan-binding domain